jgi:hypothetical protein
MTLHLRDGVRTGNRWRSWAARIAQGLPCLGRHRHRRRLGPRSIRRPRDHAKGQAGGGRETGGAQKIQRAAADRAVCKAQKDEAVDALFAEQDVAPQTADDDVPLTAADSVVFLATVDQGNCPGCIDPAEAAHASGLT